jgi:hypothetical protein
VSGPFTKESDQMNIDVVKPQENFRGLPYGHWLARWNNWLVSPDPDYYDGGEIFFLRGNLDYRPVANDIEYPRFIDPEGIYERIGENGYRIYEDTTLFIPIITSSYNLGNVLDGVLKDTEEDIRRYINKDIDRGHDMWAMIKSANSPKASKIVNNLENYRVESPLFKLVVPTNSKLNKHQYMQDEPGIYDAVVGGYCLIIRSLPRGSFRINFGARGSGDYNTNAVYDVIVEGRRPVTVRDSSGSQMRLRKKSLKIPV